MNKDTERDSNWALILLFVMGFILFVHMAQDALSVKQVMHGECFLKDGGEWARCNTCDGGACWEYYVYYSNASNHSFQFEVYDGPREKAGGWK